MLINIIKFVALVKRYSYSNKSKSFDMLIGMYRYHLINSQFYNFIGESSIEELINKIKELEVESHDIRKGFALIIINENFKKQNLRRHGAHVDKQNIKEFCRKAGFIHDDLLKTDDLTFAAMAKLFEDVSGKDFKEYDAFICFISSHGSEGGILGTDGNAMTINQIVEPIVKNSSLADKPKLFFFQNCRGKEENLGQSIVGRNPPQENEEDMELSDEGSNFPVMIPTHADTLIACSSWYGYKAYRHREKGSWFITVLTNVLTQHAKNKHLTDMLIMVNRMLANKDANGRKQMACFTCSLRKSVWIKMKNDQETSSQLPLAISGQNSET